MLFLTYVCRKAKTIFEISYISLLLGQHPPSNPHNSLPDGNPQKLKSLSPLKSHTLQSIPLFSKRTKRLS